MLFQQGLQEKRAEILQVCAKHGAKNVRVFGSVSQTRRRSDSMVQTRYCLSVGILWVAVVVAMGILAGDALESRRAARAEPSSDDRTLPSLLPQLPNPDFTQPDPQAPAGQDRPAGWRLEGDQGRWVDRQVLELQGRPKSSNYWRTEPLTWDPGRLYRFDLRVRGQIRRGCVISGPSFANRDWDHLDSQWQWTGFVFRVPDHVQKDFVRIGLWEADGLLQCDAVRLSEVLPVHIRQGDLELGEGETLRRGVYEFLGNFDGEGSNYHRVLASATASFNTDRWCFFENAQVTYRFRLPGRKFTSGRVECHLNYHSRGACVMEVSPDGQTWQQLAQQKKEGMAEAPLPTALLPAENVWIRLRTEGPKSNFQVNRVVFEAAVDPPATDLMGQTMFAHVLPCNLQAQVEDLGLEIDPTTGHRQLRATLANQGTQPLRWQWELQSTPPGQAGKTEPKESALAETGSSAGEELPPGKTARLVKTLPGSIGEHVLRLLLQKAEDVKQTVLNFSYQTQEYYRTDYGQLLSHSDQGAVWWCEAGWKVSRQRPAPEASTLEPGGAAQLAACRNDREAVQIVLRPTQPMRKVTAAVSDWTGPNGARIPAGQTRILYVYYHYIHTPTDRVGVRDWWPDALPPLSSDQPLDVPAGQNQPLWILVHVPKDTPAALYQATLTVQAEGFQVQVPLRLQVWDFTLPDRNRLETALGLSPDRIFQYHNLKTEEEKRKVLDLYFQSFAEHRISPYDPAPLDPIQVRWLPEADPPRAEVDFSAFDRAAEQAFQKYHFNTFMLSVQGMGGGTFHERWEPSIGKFGENTPQYQAMFSSYVKQLEDHLRAKGWLSMAYVYWFDEPDPKDYPFVTAGMERLKRYAPGLRRILTEEPSEELKAPVDIWCPVSPNYHHEQAEKARAQGSIFWWYVCCGPKAPYCTLFIDHPATELRVWLWQTWQRNIQGILIWSTNYWTSDAAYPDRPQNPYEDPMSYVSGYSTPKGVKRYWGNGDGRFLYPPLAAAVPGRSNGPVLEPPVSCLRWEMLREGVEDYEYLVILRELFTRHRARLSPTQVQQYESLLSVPENITKDMTHFTTDPRPIHQRRAEIAAAIETLRKLP